MINNLDDWKIHRKRYSNLNDAITSLSAIMWDKESGNEEILDLLQAIEILKKYRSECWIKGKL